MSVDTEADDMTNMIHRFEDGDASMSDVLGGKGANLAEMTKLGMPVPPGLIIDTNACKQFRKFVFDAPMDLSATKQEFVIDLIQDQVMPVLHEIEADLGYMPLLSVRSGAKFSMPGMMDTLLNIGLTTGNAKFWSSRLGALTVLDCRRRQILMYATTVNGVAPDKFVAHWNWLLGNKYGAKQPPGTSTNMLKSRKHMQKAALGYEDLYLKLTGHAFPNTLQLQLCEAVDAVFRSWDSDRAREYRELHAIDHDLGTAVVIQAMVFGNANDESCSGVAFTRDPATGEPTLMGEYVTNGQGEDVVAGADTGTEEIKPIAADTFPMEFPSAGLELTQIADKLETHYRDMMDIEFTVENGKLWMLQCRVGKRTAAAAFRIAHDMHVENLIDKATAVERVSAKQYLSLEKVRIQGEAPLPDYTGIAAGGGLIKGHVVTSSEEAKALGKTVPVILVRNETTPEDFGGMAASVGILTRFGGATSHAAVVGRSLNKVCVVGCSELPDLSDHEGMITIDGATGRVWLQDLTLTTGGTNKYAEKVLQWGIESFPTNVVMQVGIDDPMSETCQVALLDAEPESVVNFLNNLDEDETAQNVWIKMEFPGEHYLKADNKLWFLTGTMTSPVTPKRIEERLMTFCNAEYAEAKAKAVLLPCPSMTSKHIAALRTAGWSVCRRVKTVADLLDSDGAVEIDSDFAKSIGGQHVAEKLFAVMHKAGMPIEERPDAMTARRMVFLVLK